MVIAQSTERPGGCRPLNHQLGAVLCRGPLGSDAQSQSQGFVGLSSPGRASFPGSAPRQFCSAPRRLQVRGIL